MLNIGAPSKPGGVNHDRQIFPWGFL
jgi:hypothetical protein